MEFTVVNGSAVKLRTGIFRELTEAAEIMTHLERGRRDKCGK